MKAISNLFPFLFLLLSLGACNEEKPRTFPTQEELLVIMDKAVNKSDLPAVVAMAINKKGEKVTYQHGRAIWSEEGAITPEHIFRIYSMTKLITSIAALQCVEKGLITLDEDLSALMPEMTRIPILSNGAFIAPTRAITLRHLLTHTSGFGYMGNTVTAEGFTSEGWEYDDAPRHFESGTAFLYGSSTDWAGKLVEKVSGMDLESYFRKHITGPLQMNNTYFNVPDSLQALIVSYGSRGEDGNQELIEFPNRVPKVKTTYYSGGGGLFSSPADYTRLLQCLLNNGTYEGGRLLKEETIEAMNQNQVGTINLSPEGRVYDSADCCNFNGLMDEKSKWGLAYMIDNSPEDYGRREGTLMWGGLFNTYFYIDQKSGIAASIYTQHIPFNHPQTTRLFDTFSRTIYKNITE